MSIRWKSVRREDENGRERRIKRRKWNGRARERERRTVETVLATPFLRKNGSSRTITRWRHGNWATGRPDSPINLPAICNACHGHPRGIPLETPPVLRIVYVGVARQVLSRKTVLCPQWSVTKPRIGDRDGSPLFYYTLSCH